MYLINKNTQLLFKPEFTFSSILGIFNDHKDAAHFAKIILRPLDYKIISV